MEPLQSSLAIVGGAGALGNEILKNLSLLGVGNILVCDLDKIEIHNLTRSVLFRQEDAGRSKAEVAADRITEINPDINAISFDDNIGELGAGFYRRAGMIFATFDAYYPRYVLNEAGLRFGKIWVDGGMSAIEHTRGGVTVYDGSDRQSFCYACGTARDRITERINTMRGTDGCTFYENATGQMHGVPTTPMMASVVGGVQTSAALDVFYNRISSEHKCEWPFGSWEIDIRKLSNRRMRRRRIQSCYQHEMVENVERKVVEVPEWDSTRTTFREVLERAKDEHGSDRVAIEPPDDIYTVGKCRACGKDWKYFKMSVTFTASGESLICPHCGKRGTLAISGESMTGSIGPKWEHLDEPMAATGCRPLDVLNIVKYDEIGIPEARSYWEVSGDALRYGLELSARSVLASKPISR